MKTVVGLCITGQVIRTAPKGVKHPRMRNLLIVQGKETKRVSAGFAGHREKVSQSCITIYLRPGWFTLLLELAAKRIMESQGWISGTELSPNATKYLYETRKVFRNSGLDGTFIENDGGGHYRLAIPDRLIEVDVAELSRSHDAFIVRLAEQIRAARNGDGK